MKTITIRDICELIGKGRFETDEQVTLHDRDGVLVRIPVNSKFMVDDIMDMEVESIGARSDETIEIWVK